MNHFNHFEQFSIILNHLNRSESFLFYFQMTVLGRGLIVQPVLLARTYNNDTIITLQNTTLEAVAFTTRPRRRSPSRRLRAVVLTVQRGRPAIKVLTSFLVLCVGRRSGCVVCGQEGVPGGVLSVFFLTVPPLWSSGKGVSLESGRSRVRIPLALRFFSGVDSYQ